MKQAIYLLILLFTTLGIAQERLPGVFTYQGRAFQPDGVTPLTGSATFSVQVRSANGNCLLYEESHVGVDLTTSAGFFALNIGDGTASSGLAMTDSFSNLSIAKTTLSGTCGGAYTPLNQDSRVLRITVDVGGGPIALDDQYVYTAPQALVADTLSGFKYDQFVQSLSTAQRDALTSMVNGTTIYNISTGRFNRYDGASWIEAFGATNVGTGSQIYSSKMAGNDWLQLRSIIGSNGVTATQNANDITLEIDSTYAQRRVTGSCAAGNFITAVAADGTVTCAADSSGSGTVTSVTAGDAAITVAGTAADPTVALTTCADDQILKMNGAAWNCEADAEGLTSINVGATLAGDGVSTALNVAANAIDHDGVLAGAELLAACGAGEILKYEGIVNGWECATETTVSVVTANTVPVSNGTDYVNSPITLSTANVGIATAVSTARLHLPAGTAAAGTAPLKLTTGVDLGTPEIGAIEFDGTNLYFTDSVPTRRTIATSTTLGSYVLKAGDTMTGPLVNNSNSASTALAVTQSGAGYAGTFMGGNVGIGTTTPSEKLSITGNLQFNGANDTIKFLFGTQLVENFGLLATVGGGNFRVSTTPGIAFQVNPDRTVAIGGTTSSSSLGVYGNAAIGNGYVATAAPTNGLLVEGNVGIGTSAPGSRLSVNETKTDTSGITYMKDGILTVAPAANSTTQFFGERVRVNSASNAVDYGSLTGSQAVSLYNGTGTATSVVGINTAASNNSSGAVSGSGGIYASSSNGAAGSIGTAYGANLSMNNNNTAGTGVTNAFGSQSNVGNASTGTIATAYGSSNFVQNNSTGSITSAIGTSGTINNINAGGTIGTATSIYGAVSNGGNITTWYGLRIPAASGAGSITTKRPVWIEDTGNSYFAGNLGVGTTGPTAKLHLAAGTAAVNTAPLKLTSGTNLTAPEVGAIEFDGTNLYFTDSVPTRRTIATSGTLGSYVLKTGDTMTGSLRVGYSPATTYTSSMLYPASTYSSGVFLENEVTTVTNNYVQGITGYLQYNPSASAAAVDVYGQDIEVFSKSGNAQNISSMTGSFARADHRGSGTVANVYGSTSGATRSTGTTSSLTGADNYAANNGSGATVVNATGTNSSVSNQLGTITSAKAINATVLRSSGTITSGYGLYINNIEATNKWSIYANDATAPSYFAGNVGIGTTGPNEKLDVAGNIKSSGRIVASVAADTDVTISFSTTNMVRTTAAGACGTLAVSGTQAGGSFTITMPAISDTCTLPATIDGLTVKAPLGYASGVAVTGLVYTMINDGTNVWLSYVPF